FDAHILEHPHFSLPQQWKLSGMVPLGDHRYVLVDPRRAQIEIDTASGQNGQAFVGNHIDGFYVRAGMEPQFNPRAINARLFTDKRKEPVTFDLALLPGVRTYTYPARLLQLGNQEHIRRVSLTPLFPENIDPPHLTLTDCGFLSR